MPITIARDDAAKRIVATGEGQFVVDDVRTLLDALRAPGAWHYGVLLDLRRVSETPINIEDLRLVRDTTASTGESPGVRGPLALLAMAGGGHYARACAYASLAKPSGRVAVFSERTEAEGWLAAHMR